MTTGLHHVTAISGPAQENADFYNGLLGLHFVKKTVNFDDPGTYHLYYADGPAHPGSFITFFPWAGSVPGRIGAGQAIATAWAVPEGAHAYWMDRFADEGYDSFSAPTERFGQAVLPVRAPDGLALELIEVPAVTGGWTDGPIPLSAAAGAFHSVTLCTADPDATARLLTEVMGYEEAGEEGRRQRFTNPTADRAQLIDLTCPPGIPPGRMGTGTVHHVAFRVPTGEAQLEAREMLLQAGLQPTPVIDRQYFHSIYFREPGGVLFEIATDAPGFTVDEDYGALGTGLMLPPQYEHLREQITERVPPLTIPHPSS